MNDSDEADPDCNVTTVVDRESFPTRLWFQAKRDIQPGEELQYSYGEEYWPTDP